MSDPISRDIALRIALAAQALPGIETVQLLKVLDELVGLPPTPEALAKLTVKQFRSNAGDEFKSVNTDDLKQALVCLRGEAGIEIESDLPEVQAFDDIDMPGSIRVACASNKAEELDGHFGSCARFLIYQVGAGEIRLIDVRSSDGPDARDDKNAYRAGLISDCQVLFVASIGGPAAAKVIKTGVHPIKHLTGGNARDRVADLQTVLATAPPPWLAKAMGQNEESRVRFERTAES
jgi:nitrogen fixation protein NifX